MIKYEILHEGDVNVNDTYIREQSDKCVAFIVDLNVKYCVIDGYTDTPSVLISAPSSKDYTEIAFPDHEGWAIFSASMSKYSLMVCMVKLHNGDKDE